MGNFKIPVLLVLVCHFFSTYAIAENASSPMATSKSADIGNIFKTTAIRKHLHTLDWETANADSVITIEGNRKVISDGDSKPEEQDNTEYGSHDIDTGRVVRTY